MSRQRRNFSAKFKSDLVIELLKGEKDLNTLATENNIQPNLLRNWKKEFLNNASVVFDDKREENLKEKRFPIYTLQSSRKFDDSLIYYELIEEVKDDKKPFNSFITYQPNQINFWMEFHDAKDELSKFSVRAIGQRSKNVNDNKITSIYYRVTPNLIFSSKDINYED